VDRQGQWKLIPELKRGGPWWGVPAWTVPLLRVAGADPIAREGAVILAVLNEAISSPQLLLSEENTTLLLGNFRRTEHDTVDEALSARGGVKQITLDLQAVVRQEIPLVHLQYVLDGLAQAPAGADAIEAARFVAKTYYAPESPARAQLTGPHRRAAPP